MRTFKEIAMNEAFDSPTKFKLGYTGDDFDIFRVDINNNTYGIIMNKIPLDNKEIGYNIAFKHKNEDGQNTYLDKDNQVDTKEIMTLFSTILAILKTYDNISYLEFEPNEERKVKLYNTFAKKLKNYFNLDNVATASKDQKIKIFKGSEAPKYKKRFLDKITGYERY